MLNHSTLHPTEPAVNPDKTLTGIVATPARLFPGYGLLSLRLPAGLTQEGVAGRYFLARCGAQSEFERLHNWHFYARRPLFAAGLRSIATTAEVNTIDLWQLLIPHSVSGEAAADPALHWLLDLLAGASLNLLGPFGQGFTLQPTSRRLLLVAAWPHVATLFPIIEPMLDQGGHVTLIVDATASADSSSVINSLIPQLPIAVEIHVKPNVQELQQQIAEAIPWADQICTAILSDQHQPLADLIRAHRFRLDDGFAQALVQSDLLCGVGACLACVISLPSGSPTRACIHGPVMDLSRLTV